MKFLFLLVSVLIFSNSITRADDSYGAIAFSPSTGAFGKSMGRPDQATAESFAVWNCGEWDCKAVVWVRNACAALAVGLGNGYGWAWDVVPVNAEMRALAECGARAGDCVVVSTICSYQ